MEIDGVNLTLENLGQDLLELLVGERWPDGDENAMRRLAAEWSAAANELEQIRQDATGAAKGVGQYLQGANGDAFHSFWSSSFDDGKPTSALPFSARFCKSMADALNSGATQIETTKETIMGNIAILAATLTPQIAAGFVDFGATDATAVAEIALERTAMQALLDGAKELILTTVEQAIEQGLEQAGLNFTIQLQEVAEGHASSINLGSVGQAGLAGAEGGALGTGLGVGVGALGSKVLGEGIASSVVGKAVSSVATGGLTNAAMDLAQTGHISASDFGKGSLAGAAGAAADEGHGTDDATSAIDTGHSPVPDIPSVPDISDPTTVGRPAAAAETGTSSGAVASDSGRTPEAAQPESQADRISRLLNQGPAPDTSHDGQLANAASSAPAAAPGHTSVGQSAHTAQPTSQADRVSRILNGGSAQDTGQGSGFASSASAAAPDHLSADLDHGPGSGNTGNPARLGSPSGTGSTDARRGLGAGVGAGAGDGHSDASGTAPAAARPDTASPSSRAPDAPTSPAVHTDGARLAGDGRSGGLVGAVGHMRPADPGAGRTDTHGTRPEDPSGPVGGGSLDDGVSPGHFDSGRPRDSAAPDGVRPEDRRTDPKAGTRALADDRPEHDQADGPPTRPEPSERGLEPRSRDDGTPANSAPSDHASADPSPAHDASGTDTVEAAQPRVGDAADTMPGADARDGSHPGADGLPRPAYDGGVAVGSRTGDDRLGPPADEPGWRAPDAGHAGPDRPGADHASPGRAESDHSGPGHDGGDQGRQALPPPHDDSASGDGGAPGTQHDLIGLLVHGSGASGHGLGARGLGTGRDTPGRTQPHEAGAVPEHLSDISANTEVNDHGISMLPDPAMRDTQRLIPPDPHGAFDINLHGNATSGRARGRNLTAQDLLDLANANGHQEGQTIRLTSCDAGARDDGLASELARISGCKVIAADSLVWTDSAGHMFASGSHRDFDRYDVPDIPPTGHWHEFSPDGTKVQLDENGFPPGQENGFSRWGAPVGDVSSRATREETEAATRTLDHLREQWPELKSVVDRNETTRQSLLDSPECVKFLDHRMHDVQAHLDEAGIADVVRHGDFTPEVNRQIESITDKLEAQHRREDFDTPQPGQLDTSQSIRANTTPGGYRQSGFDLNRREDPAYQEECVDRLRAEAPAAQRQLNATVRTLADRNDGAAESRLAVKNRDRCLAKVREYVMEHDDGDASMLVDVTGAKIRFDDIDHLYKALDDLKNDESLAIVRIKDRFDRPTPSGSRDILLNVRMENGHVGELKLRLKEPKPTAADHPLYELRRDLESNARAENRPMKPVESLIKSVLEARSREECGAMWNREMAGSHLRAGLRGHDDIASLAHGLVRDSPQHPTNLANSLLFDKEYPETRAATIDTIRELADKRLLGNRTLDEYRAENAGQGSLFEPVDPLVNTDAAGRDRKTTFLDQAKPADPARDVGPTPTGEEHDLVQDYAQRLKEMVEPAVRAEAEVLVQRADPTASLNIRTKDADGILDKVNRMTSGSGGRAPRPGYRAGDVIDAVGARITTNDTHGLARILEAAKNNFGVGDGGRILEIENMYAAPKPSNPNYRVIPLIVRVDVDGLPYTYELQLTTRRASIASDMDHNTIFKPYVKLTDSQKEEVKAMFVEAAALDQEETRNPEGTS